MAVLYHGHSIQVRTIELDDMPVLHEWLQSPAFQFYRPQLNTCCPTIYHLQQRLTTLASIEPAIEIETLVLQLPSYQPIGCMALSSIDRLNRKAEFSMGFSYRQGTHCTLEAWHFALEQVFSMMQFHKLIFYAASNNVRARRLIEHHAILQEGLLRQEIQLTNGVFVDLHRYALLECEWLTGSLRQHLRRLAPLKH